MKKMFFVDYNDTVIMVGHGRVSGHWFENREEAIACYEKLCKMARMGQAHFPTLSETSGLLLEYHERPLLTDMFYF